MGSLVQVHLEAQKSRGKAFVFLDFFCACLTAMPLDGTAIMPSTLVKSPTTGRGTAATLGGIGDGQSLRLVGPLRGPAAGGIAVPTPHISSMYAPWGFFHFEAAGLMQTYGLRLAGRATSYELRVGYALQGSYEMRVRCAGLPTACVLPCGRCAT